MGDVTTLPGAVAVAQESAVLKRGRGRPPLLDPARRTEFLAALRFGNTRADAARQAGLKPGTVEEWIRRAEGHDDRAPSKFYLDLYEDILNAESSFRVYLHAQYYRQLPTQPALIARALENFDPRWRQYRAPVQPAPAPGSVTLTEHTERTIVFTPEELQFLASERLRRARDVTPLSPEEEAERDRRRARLVTDSATS